jgi:L-threonylcarbamoyladenylate synthase
VNNFPPIAPDIIKAAKNPLSIVYSESKGLAKNVSADSTICIRVVDNDFCKALIHKLGHPITSTSANLAGDKAPSIYVEITDQIKSSVDYVVQLYHDVLTKPKASTIIRLYEDNHFDIIRQ